MPRKTQRPRLNRARRVVAATTTAVPVQRCWSSKFPDDLLAVCRSWRAAARAAPPVPLPWLQLSPCSSESDTTMKKHLYCPEDGLVVRLPLPASGKRDLVGCYDGGWIATFMPASLRIVNISSGAKVKLGQRQEKLVCGDHIHDSMLKIYGFSEMLKVVFSEPPTSPGCILATVVNHDTVGHCIGLCRVGCPDKSGWTIQRCHGRTFVDITFCDGELYGITENATEIIKFEIAVNEDGAPVVIAQHPLAMEGIDDSTCLNSSKENVNYIFDLHGKFAMAKWTQWSHNLQPFFKVFELVDVLADTHKHKWVEVMDLGDHALFLGWAFSKAVQVPANGRRGGVERNHIYFSHHERFNGHFFNAIYTKFASMVDERGYQEYYMEKTCKKDIIVDEVTRIGSVGYFRPDRYCTEGINNRGGVWVIPPDI